jgi:hypothetical protein
VRHTEKTGRARLLLGRFVSFAPRHSNLGRVRSFNGVSRLIANHLDLAIFESAPEVRGLPSARITRFQRYYAPVRLPPDPPPSATMKPRPPIGRVSPVARITLPACHAHYPGGSNGCMCRLLPHPCGLPRFAGGSASASLLSRPAQASLALRPVGLLNRPRRPSSRGFDRAGCPAKPLVSYQGNRQFPGWNPPPRVKRAFRGALQKSCRPCEKSGAFAPIGVNAPKLAGARHIAPKLTS